MEFCRCHGTQITCAVEESGVDQHSGVDTTALLPIISGILVQFDFRKAFTRMTDHRGPLLELGHALAEPCGRGGGGGSRLREASDSVALNPGGPRAHPWRQMG